MCHASCIDFVVRAISKKDIENKKVLEVGSYNVNGSARSYIEQLNPSSYIGVDIEHGPGVDEICNSNDLLTRFGENSFDVLISTEALEHIEDWRLAISNFKKVIKPDGIIVITTRSFGFFEHNFPSDYWRYESTDIEAIFSDCNIEMIEKDKQSYGIFAKIKKPLNFNIIDLSQYNLYSMKTKSILNLSDDSGINYYRELISKNVSTDVKYIAQKNIGRIKLKQKKYRESINEFLKSIEIDDRWAESYYYIGVNYFNLKDWHKCIKWMSMAINVTVPDSDQYKEMNIYKDDPYRYIFASYDCLGDYKNAEKYCKLAYKKNNDIWLKNRIQHFQNMSKNILDEFAIKYNTDKGSKFHNYTKYYDRYFGKDREHVSKILEIGVCNGASLKMWKDYFPNSAIYGIDILEKCKEYNDSRTNVFIGSQDDSVFLENVIKNIGRDIDIIIDDGSHLSPHQINSFIYLFPFVKSQGMYIIEDVNTSYWEKFDGGLKKNGTCIEFFKNRIDDIYFSGHRYKNTDILNADLILLDKPNLNLFEKSIESIHFYNGLIIILKR